MTSLLLIELTFFTKSISLIYFLSFKVINRFNHNYYQNPSTDFGFNISIFSQYSLCKIDKKYFYFTIIDFFSLDLSLQLSSKYL